MLGGDGNDVLRSGTSSGNVLDGGAGDDTISLLGSGDNEVTGGAGNDSIILNTGSNILYFNSGDGQDTIIQNLDKGQDEFDTVVFGSGIAL